MTTAAHGRSVRAAVLEAITSLRPQHTALTEGTTLAELGFDSLDVGRGDWTPYPVTMGRGATIGAGAVIAPGVRIGAYALVALGAVVFHDVAAHALVAGNPARQCGWVCLCGHTLDPELRCPHCPRTYTRSGGELALLGWGGVR